MKAKVCKHLFNIPHQYTQLQFLHRSLKEDEAILHIDYAENWQCKYAKEVHQVHFGASDRQTTLHNAVVYTTDCTLTFCALSPSMKHDPPVIWAQLLPVLKFLKDLKFLKNHPRIQKLFFISDGPNMQYREEELLSLEHHSFPDGIYCCKLEFSGSWSRERACRWRWSHHEENCLYFKWFWMIMSSKIKLFY